MCSNGHTMSSYICLCCIVKCRTKCSNRSSDGPGPISVWPNHICIVEASNICTHKTNYTSRSVLYCVNSFGTERWCWICVLCVCVCGVHTLYCCCSFFFLRILMNILSSHRYTYDFSQYNTNVLVVKQRQACGSYTDWWRPILSSLSACCVFRKTNQLFIIVQYWRKSSFSNRIYDWNMIEKFYSGAADITCYQYYLWIAERHRSMYFCFLFIRFTSWMRTKTKKKNVLGISSWVCAGDSQRHSIRQILTSLM